MVGIHDIEISGMPTVVVELQSLVPPRASFFSSNSAYPHPLTGRDLLSNVGHHWQVFYSASAEVETVRCYLMRGDLS